MRTLALDAGVLKAVLNEIKKTVLKNRFFEADFLLDNAEGKINARFHLLFGLG